MKKPQHVAIIMDGNGRWATRRLLPRIEGHRRGVESVRVVVKECLNAAIPYLTLFTFSSENWRRPKSEVDFLFGLLLELLRKEVAELHQQGVCLKIKGDTALFSPELQEAIQQAEAVTANNTKLHLNIAFNYGGRWDMLQAVKAIGHDIASGKLLASAITDTTINERLIFSDSPEPDLLIRTSGEYRISNFMLWQLAYTEMYFTQTFWPEFRQADFQEALRSFSDRQRRFGYVQEVSKEESVNSLPVIERKAHA